MKIGEFAKKNDITIDTVRHYIDLGLILPIKKTGQYDFDLRCEKDIKDIQRFKEMKFSLNEIKEILTFKTLGNLDAGESKDFLKNIFNNHISRLEKEGLEIHKALALVKELKEDYLSLKSHQSINLGLGISDLSIFSSYENNLPLIKDAKIVDGLLREGILARGKDDEMKIDDGIIKYKGFSERIYFEDHLNYFDVENYIKATDKEFLKTIKNMIEWMIKQIDFESLKGKVILELGTGVGFLLRNIYAMLPADCVYIAVDRNVGLLKRLKEILERSGEKKNVIFLASDFATMPIGKEKVDIVLDFAGSSNFGFENEEFLLKTIDHQIKKEAELYGSYIVFKLFKENSKIDRNLRKNFLEKNIREYISSLGFEMKSENISSVHTKAGDLEEFWVEGEEFFSYSYAGKRWG
ncbi:DNA-binding transcriptional MerR regulator/SAM-dependent methyltransferase [Acetoanaerobium pronyense]|uniref:DNA-binding transcriptional MerR regulator/SAM-dependent methyltransferase n=1 Tax=Acetoanaerobium pronyense TaxID=1482736 RepID=A0ABS4KHK8_9FIRM|nr:MerR family transcriptional regulator [Acetoanaerobium pronyense]MBP2027269.1 DNA-binding transcriptional MerR regulator/SAM-dependent methyltransferase [Acetoanaerobium pronyense]